VQEGGGVLTAAVTAARRQRGLSKEDHLVLQELKLAGNKGGPSKRAAALLLALLDLHNGPARRSSRMVRPGRRPACASCVLCSLTCSSFTGELSAGLTSGAPPGAPRPGMWTKTLRKNTNLSPQLVARALTLGAPPGAPWPGMWTKTLRMNTNLSPQLVARALTSGAPLAPPGQACGPRRCGRTPTCRRSSSRARSRTWSFAFDCLQSSHRVPPLAPGMWTKTLRKNTNLSPQLVARALKNLEQRSLVKSVKSIQSATKKLYMLAELEPATEITGGAWRACLPDRNRSHQEAVHACMSSSRRPRSPAAPGAPALPTLTPATRKLHMLHELEPATEINGGAWRACLPYPSPSPPAHARARD